ncbi:hypothetical protein D3C73_1376330 [compost metagenome]
MGTLALYGILVLVASSDLMKHLGKKLWRAIHFLALPTFALALFHGISSGSDSGNPLFQGMYWVTGGAVVLLTYIRIASVLKKRSEKKPAITVVSGH